MTVRASVFLGLTLVTTTHAGMFHHAAFYRAIGERVHLWSWETLVGGLWFSLPLLSILGAHEAGHKMACHSHGIRTAGPYFVPVGLPLVGTFGAILRIKDRIPDRTALIDVGLSGPVFGFLVAVPLAMIGVTWSYISPLETNVVRFGHPWLLDRLAGFALGDGLYLLHPMGLAAWLGLLLTMLNLLPFGQFDGGHIIKGAFGRDIALAVSWFTVITASILATRSLTWFMAAALMILSMMFRPADVIDTRTVPTHRWAYVAVAAVILALCWNQV